MRPKPPAAIDTRFSDPEAGPTPWPTDEQKARNLEHHSEVAVTTGTNTWAEGLDVVVEGTAVRVTDREALQALADAYEAKYGSVWHFDVGDGVFVQGDGTAAVFRVEAAKVLAFAKAPHAQTTYRFAAP